MITIFYYPYEKLPEEAKKNIPVNINDLSTIDDIYIDTRYPAELGLFPNGFPSTEQAQEIIEFCSRIFVDAKTYLNPTTK